MKLAAIGVMLLFAAGCSSSEEEPTPNQPGTGDPDEYTFSSKELVVEPGQIVRLGHQVDYGFLGGYDYRLYCEFKYQDRVVFLDMSKPRAYDSAKTVNAMAEITPGIVTNDIELDTLVVSYTFGPYISGVVFHKFEPFTINVDLIPGTETADQLRGLEKITIKVNSGVPFSVRIRTHLANEKFYAEYYLQYPKEFPELFNERIKVFTGRKMHINGWVRVD